MGLPRAVDSLGLWGWTEKIAPPERKERGYLLPESKEARRPGGATCDSTASHAPLACAIVLFDVDLLV